MAGWQDRLKEATYTSPSGIIQKYLYDDLNQTIEKKTTSYEFPEAIGTYVQELGITGRRCPMTIYFSGRDCDFEADTFMAALSETGVGVLSHPVYGLLSVIPFGEIKREDAIVSSANVVKITVLFMETVNIYDLGAQDNAEAISAGIAQWYYYSADDFADKTDLDTELKRKTLSDYINGFIDDLNDFMAPLYETFENIQREYNAISDSLLRGLDTLIGRPSTLAFQTSLLLQAPGRTLTSIRQKFDAYLGVFSNTIGNVPKNSNEFFYRNLAAGSLLAGMAGGAIESSYSTQEEALNYASLLATTFEAYTDWRDGFEYTDSDEAYRRLQNFVALTIGNLAKLSFTLRKRIVIELDRDRNIVELEAELYGTIDINLDFLIESNNLNGNERVVVPKGKEIVYYA